MLQKKIMLCGDSISKGIIYDNISSKYRKCEKAFSGVFEKIFKTKLLNISGFGNTVKRAERKFYRTFSEYLPDIVIFGLGGNDCDFDWAEVSKNPREKHLPKTDMNSFIDTLGNMIVTVKDEGKRPVLMNLSPLDPERYFKWITRNDEVREDRVLEWLGSVSKIYWWQERYNSAVQNIARDRDIEIVDIRSEFLREFDFRKCLCEDGIHPNPEGQQLIAKAMTEHFKYNISA